jgi:hypothetical protein
LNEYEKRFVEHIARLGVTGLAFTRLVRKALEAEYGGEMDSLLSNLNQTTLEDPEEFAVEVYKAFGTDSMQYFVTIVKYAESEAYHPDEDSELEKEEEELESLVGRLEPDSGGRATPGSLSREE